MNFGYYAFADDLDNWFIFVFFIKEGKKIQWSMIMHYTPRLHRENENWYGRWRRLRYYIIHVGRFVVLMCTRSFSLIAQPSHEKSHIFFRSLGQLYYWVLIQLVTTEFSMHLSRIKNYLEILKTDKLLTFVLLLKAISRPSYWESVSKS